MIKNLIFDLDNTIIKDQESDALYYKEALKKYGYDENDYIKIYNVIDEYDKSFTEEDYFYNKERLLNFINKYLQRNYSIDLIDEISDIIGKYWTQNVNLKEEIIKKLADKYDLYIYTNYFEDAQEKRIVNIGYEKYFKKIFAADKYGCKPYKKSFEKVLKEIEATAEECIMIGDSKNIDILAASNVGMKAILYDYDGKRDKKEIVLDNYIVIKDMRELLDIL